MKTPKSPASPPKPCSACNPEEKTGVTTKTPRHKEDQIQEQCTRLRLEKTGLKTQSEPKESRRKTESNPIYQLQKFDFEFMPARKQRNAKELDQSILPVFSVFLRYRPYLLFNLFLFYSILISVKFPQSRYFPASTIHQFLSVFPPKFLCSLYLNQIPASKRQGPR